MTWRKEIRKVAFANGEKPGASFRGVPFRTTDSDARVGRRNQVHEYPQRDVPFAEDLGRRAREFQVTGYVVGDDYLQQRDKLIEALEAYGPGELVHPRYGSLNVVVVDQASIREGSSEGGIARFVITFAEAGRNTFPQAASSTPDQVQDTADALDDAACTRFGAAADVTGAQVLEEDLATRITSGLDDLQQMVSLNGLVDEAGDLVRSIASVSGRIATLIRTPVVLAQSLQALYQDLSLAISRPKSALADLRSQFSSNDVGVATTATGTTAAQRQVNTVAAQEMFRAMTLSAQARVLSDAIGTSEIATAQDAKAQAQLMLDLVDHELEIYDPAATVARALLDLRAAIVRDVSERADKLLQRATVTTQAVLPALQIAQRVYQDATRADELVARNGVRHPLFVAAGTLEVLR